MTISPRKQSEGIVADEASRGGGFDGETKKTRRAMMREGESRRRKVEGAGNAERGGEGRETEGKRRIRHG